MENWTNKQLIDEKLQCMSDINRCKNEIVQQCSYAVQNNRLIKKYKGDLEKLENRLAEIDIELDKRDFEQE